LLRLEDYLPAAPTRVYKIGPSLKARGKMGRITSSRVILFTIIRPVRRRKERKRRKRKEESLVLALKSCSSLHAFQQGALEP